MNTFTWLISALVLSFMVYIFLVLVIFPSQIQSIGKNEYNLNVPTSVISNEQLRGPWTSGSGSSLIFYINPRIIDRTARSGDPGEEYAKVVQIGEKQSFQILIAPDAGRGLYKAPARLQIFVNGKDRPEYAEIPNFPLQRWTAVVIVKFGRRFNIYLNGKLVVTHVCSSMPLFDTTQSLKVGDRRLSGTISLMSLSSSAMTTDEVRYLIRDTTDTSGKPRMPFTLSNLFSSVFMTLPHGWWCSGACCKKSLPIRPMEEWSTPYA